MIDFKSLFSLAPLPILVLSPDLKIVGVNEAYLAATMTVREKIIGRGLFEVFPDNPEDAQANGESNLRRSLARVIRQKSVDTMAVQKYDIPKPNEAGFEERYWSPVNTPILDENKNVKYILHCVTDVTDFVRVKNQTTASSKLPENRKIQLEAEIFTRAQEIQELNAALEKKEKELENQTLVLKHLNQELEAFSYSVSHDLRAPLRSLSGFSQILLEQYAPNLDAKAKDFLSRISQAARMMGQLIDGLLDFSRLNRKEISKEKVFLSELVQNIVHELKASDETPKVVLDFVPDVVVDGDPLLIRAMMTNLLGNAWKFSRKKEEIRIQFGKKEADGKSIYFVKDNGVGFDMKYADKLFGVFQRLHSVKDFQGTGIGLATSQRIIHRHGGEIWAESVPGEGATFYFTI